MFLKCYQQSLFSLVHSVYPGIKIIGRRIKKLNGYIVYGGGFPESGLKKILPDATITNWGAEVDCEIVDESAYRDWLAGLTTPVEASAGKSVTEKIISRKFYLSEEACRFLDSWGPGLFPASVDAGFILGLKPQRERWEE